MRLSEKCSSKSMTNILMHFKYDNIYMKIDRFEISSDLGKYIEYNCEQIRSHQMCTCLSKWLQNINSVNNCGYNIMQS